MQQLSHGERKRLLATCLSVNEIMTILFHFYQYQSLHFNDYYFFHLLSHLNESFPELVSYQRFVVLMPSVLIPLYVYLNQRRASSTGIAFIVVCHNRRIDNHQAFKKLAKKP